MFLKPSNALPDQGFHGKAAGWSHLILSLAGLLIFALGSQSCVSHKDQVTLNEVEIKKGVERDTLLRENGLAEYEPIKIRPYDQLMIKINAFEGSTEEFLNREFTTGGIISRNIVYDPPSIYFNSYPVNEEGNIFLPILEEINVAGLTTYEVKKIIDEAYKPYLKRVTSSVKLANLRVTVFGEVEEPGVQYLYNERTTLFDAISLAGDFTDFSNRKKVKLVRRIEPDRTKTVMLNLNKPDFLNSEYYFVQPEDVIYVEPLKAKAFDTSARSLGIIISVISVAAVITSIVVP